MPNLRPVPASSLVSWANNSPPLASNSIATLQALPNWEGLGSAYLRFLPVKPVFSNKFWDSSWISFPFASNLAWLAAIASVSFFCCCCNSCCFISSCSSSFCLTFKNALASLFSRRKSSWAVPPNTLSAWAGSFTPGSWTRIWSCPTVWITGSDTPKPLTRFSTTVFTASSSRSVICLISCEGFTWIVNWEPPWRSNPRATGNLTITTIAAIRRTIIRANSDRCLCIP